jgi:hypothetical protein
MLSAIVVLPVLVALAASPSAAQDTATIKGFTRFKEPVRGIDFFAASRQLVTPFEKPLAEARQRLASLLGADLPAGAIFICSTLQQKDAVWEPRILKMGYKWVLTSLTPEARAEEMLARMKSQMGDQLTPEILERIRSRAGDPQGPAAAGMVRTTVREMALATLQAAFAPEREFRASRLDDVARSPLPDWLDIGIASYAAAGGAGVAFLQQRIEEAFPLEDVLGMSRPFVAPSASGGGGGGMVIRMGGAPPDGAGPPGGSGTRAGGGARELSKDQQDRMLFDGQASTFFNYLVEKLGIEKVGQLIRFSRDGKPSRDWITAPEALGPAFDKIESDWMAWVKAQKAERPEEMRIRMNPDTPPNPPE